jgi:hypothetical protein
MRRGPKTKSVIARLVRATHFLFFKKENGSPAFAGDDGSVLVEAMVGAAIIAMTLIGMYQSIINSAAHNRMAESRRTAMMIAQSELAAVGPIIPSMPGTTEGTEGDFYWRVDIAPYQQPGSQPPQPVLGQAPNPTGTLCLVTVTVADQRRGPLAVLTSLTLARGS